MFKIKIRFKFVLNLYTILIVINVFLQWMIFSTRYHNLLQITSPIPYVFLFHIRTCTDSNKWFRLHHKLGKVLSYKCNHFLQSALQATLNVRNASQLERFQWPRKNISNSFSFRATWLQQQNNYAMHSFQSSMRYWTEYLNAFNWTDAISCIYCIFKFAQVLSKWWSYHRFMSWDTKASVHVFFFFTTNTNHFRELKEWFN